MCLFFKEEAYGEVGLQCHGGIGAWQCGGLNISRPVLGKVGWGGGYTIKYKKYAIEDITGGAYKIDKKNVK